MRKVLIILISSSSRRALARPPHLPLDVREQRRPRVLVIVLLIQRMARRVAQADDGSVS